MEENTNSEVIIYTDGSCSGNPGPGGWAAILIHKASGKERRISGGEAVTTNNRMEITAVLEALKCLKRPVTADVYSDSKYVLNTFDKNWIQGWIAKGWVTSDKKPVKNEDLWKELYTEVKKHNITWHYVPGHKNIEYNEICDQMAREQTELHKNAKSLS